MLSRSFARSILGQWVTTFTCLGLIIAPFGCETVTVLQDGKDGEFGWFVNADKASDVLLGARATGGESLFAYGTWAPDGEIDEITAILLRDAEGNESFITLESGRPVHLQAADGSYAHITYNEVSEERLAWTVELYDADTDTAQEFSGEVDLQQALADALAAFTDLTGIEVPEVANPEEENAKGVSRSAETVYYPAFMIPFVYLAYFISFVATQIMTVVYSAVALALQATVLAIYAPVLILAQITNGLLLWPVQTVWLAFVFGRMPLIPVSP